MQNYAKSQSFQDSSSHWITRQRTLFATGIPRNASRGFEPLHPPGEQDTGKAVLRFAYLAEQEDLEYNEFREVIVDVLNAGAALLSRTGLARWRKRE